LQPDELASQFRYSFTPNKQKGCGRVRTKGARRLCEGERWRVTYGVPGILRGRVMTGEKRADRIEAIEKRILLLRGERVMLSTDLAALYQVEPRVLVQAVKRNHDRFPEDFMVQLTREEVGNLKSQVVISSWGGPRRASPYAFTEQGVAMLSSVLRSPLAVRVNVEIMRAFVRLRRLLVSHEDLARKLEKLEQRYDAQFRVVFDAIRQLMAPPERPRRSIGFRVEEARPGYGSPRRRAAKPAR
jgi:hypothetical protein